MNYKRLIASFLLAVCLAVPVHAQSLLEPSGLTVEQMSAGLLKDLKPYAADFIKAEQDTGVNAVFLAAVAAIESGWNTSTVATTYNNVYGWTSNDGTYSSFASVTDCINCIANKLKNMYLSPDGVYFNGYTIDAVNTRYNGTEYWATMVKQIMSEILWRAYGH